MPLKSKMILAGIALLILAVLGMYAYLRMPSVERRISHAKSEAIGINRTITLYAYDGKPLKSWKGRVQVELYDGAARFVTGGKTVIISGTYIIEED